jgi:sigma54-dependent transcription regulator
VTLELISHAGGKDDLPIVKITRHQNSSMFKEIYCSTKRTELDSAFLKVLINHIKRAAKNNKLRRAMNSAEIVCLRQPKLIPLG